MAGVIAGMTTTLDEFVEKAGGSGAALHPDPARFRGAPRDLRVIAP